MKRIFFTSILLLCFMIGWSQNRPNNDRIKAQKVAFLTERLDLSSKEAQSFWPIYNAFEDKISKIRREDLRSVRQAMSKGNLSESEAQDVLDQFMAVEATIYQAKLDLVKDLRGVISPQKIVQLKVSEDAFNKWLMEQIRKKRQERMNRNKP